jgi:hypothetical protein
MNEGYCASRARTRAIVLAAALTFPSAFLSGDSAGEPIRVSLVQLIATPSMFEGRRVIVQGFCRQGFEERSLYLHREDAEFLNLANAVWLETTGEQRQ